MHTVFLFLKLARLLSEFFQNLQHPFWRAIGRSTSDSSFFLLITSSLPPLLFYRFSGHDALRRKFCLFLTTVHFTEACNNLFDLVKFVCHPRETPYPAAARRETTCNTRARARGTRRPPFLLREDGRESTVRD